MLFSCMSKLSSYKHYSFLIPDSIESHFVLIYNQECGIKPEIKNNSKILKVPKNGVLIISEKVEKIINKYKFFIVDSLGVQKEIKIYQDFVTKEKNIPGIKMGNLGVLGGKMPDGSSSSKSPLAIRFVNFQIIKDSNQPIQVSELTPQVRSILQECRN